MNIVITGASRGIGFDTALKLASDPGNKIIAFSRNEHGLAALKDSAVSGNIHTHVMDLVSCSGVDIERALAGIEEVDILVNNAGQLVNKMLVNSTLDEWRKTFEVNLFGPIKMIQALIPLMRRGNSLSHIVNIGSMGGMQGTSKFAGLSAYSASKAAFGNLTECLAEELKGDNIRVNCLALGAVNTEMLQEAFPGYIAPLSSPEIASYIADFSVNGHRFMNGKIIPVSIATP